ncbi:MAG: hypothetical protein LUH15_19355, partial [Tannerellaceae bacterium]|nr:hypothetical protein [Tannerellaceae bacterium]
GGSSGSAGKGYKPKFAPRRGVLFRTFSRHLQQSTPMERFLLTFPNPGLPHRGYKQNAAMRLELLNDKEFYLNLTVMPLRGLNPRTYNL